MRRHARFGHHIHGFRAHLKFNVDTGGAHQGGVQGLVTIDFANRNVIFKSAGHRLVHLVQDTQCRVAINDRRHDKPEAINVGDLGKAQVFAIHFFINGKKSFFTTRYLRLNASLRKGCF